MFNSVKRCAIAVNIILTTRSRSLFRCSCYATILLWFIAMGRLWRRRSSFSGNYYAV